MRKIIILPIILLFFTSCITIYAPSPSYPGGQLSKQKTKVIKKSFEFSPGSLLKMNAEVGTYKIEGKPQKKLVYNGKVSASTPDFFYDTDFSIKKEDDKTFALKASVFKKSIKEVEITGNIFVPFETNIKGIFKEAKVDITSIRGNISLTSNYLNSTLADVSGKVSVFSKSGHVRLTILEWDKSDSFSIVLDEGDIEFFAPKEAKLDIITDTGDNKVTKKYEFKKGKTRVYLKVKKGEILIDKI